MPYRDMTHPDIEKMNLYGDLRPGRYEPVPCEGPGCDNEVTPENAYIGRYSGVFCSKVCHDKEWEIEEEI